MPMQQQKTLKPQQNIKSAFSVIVL